ncbi:hypothetical protein C8R47DRAFT_1329761 [Mycena vitilis]|nr:hypothetical protein C8R47DRAFT_1329761 [Mycena vitilis]
MISYPQSSYPSALTADSDLTPAGWESDFPARVDGTAEGQSYLDGMASQDESKWHSQPSATVTYMPSLDGMDSTYSAQPADNATMYSPSHQTLDTSSYSSSATPCHPSEEQHVSQSDVTGILDASSYPPFDSAETFVDPNIRPQLSMSPQNAWESFDNHAQDLVNANMLLQFSMSGADSSASHLPPIADTSSVGVQPNYWQGQASPQICDMPHTPAGCNLRASLSHNPNSFGSESSSKASTSMPPVRYAPYFRPSAQQRPAMTLDSWQGAHFSPSSSASSSPEIAGPSFSPSAHPYSSSATTTPRIHSYSLPPSPMPIAGPSVPPSRVGRRSHRAKTTNLTPFPQTEPIGPLQWCMVLPHELKQYVHVQSRPQARPPPCPAAGTFSKAEVTQKVAAATKLLHKTYGPIKCDWDNCGQTVAVDKLLRHLQSEHGLPSSVERTLCKWGVGKERCRESKTPMLAGGMMKHLFSGKHLALPLPCSLCGAVFYRSDALGDHLRGF